MGKKSRKGLWALLFVIIFIVLISSIGVLGFFLDSQVESYQYIPSGFGNIFTTFSSNKIAVIDINGPISPSSGFLSSGVSPSNILPLLEEAEYGNYGGALIRIDSPGGTVVASRTISQSIKDMKKPTVCLLGDAAASGAYWIASACDHIVSDPLSITGSVGVTASYLEYSQFFEKYGIKYERIVSAENKDEGSPFRNLTVSGREKMQKLIDDIFEYFLNDVVTNRNLTAKQTLRIAGADIFLGKDSIELGLVDEIGSVKEAKAAIERLTGLTNPEYVELGQQGALNFF